VTPSELADLTEVRSVVEASPEGELLGARPDASPASADLALGLVVASHTLGEVGALLGFTELESVVVRGGKSSTVTAVRSGRLLVIETDPLKSTTKVEQALAEWQPEPLADSGPRSASTTPEPSPGPAPSAQPGGRLAAQWRLVRRKIVLGQLAEAAAHLCDTDARPGDELGPGCEQLSAEEREQAMQSLFEGIGSVMAGDGLGGGTRLQQLATGGLANLSLRWLAAYWSARAALRNANLMGAGAMAAEVTAMGPLLGDEAKAIGLWLAADVALLDGHPQQALDWLAEARTSFEARRDPWGAGQTWLSEAKVLASLHRDKESTVAARRAIEANVAWEEPRIFLLQRALRQGELPAAESILRGLHAGSGARERAILDAVRSGGLTRECAAEFLELSNAPPSREVIRALERIAAEAPKFAPVQETLAWVLLRLGRYQDSGAVFRGLLALPLQEGERASVKLGLDTIEHALQSAPARTGKLSSSPGSGSGAVFSGDLADLAIPDLLEFLRSGRRTGLLVCSSPKGMAALRFRAGFIIGAATPTGPTLGELLVRAQRLSASVLKTTLAKRSADQPEHVLGEVLVQSGLVDVASVRDALSEQIRLALRELIQWTEGQFTFDKAGGESPSRSIEVDVDPQAVILNVVREMDEATRGEHG
jgi:hypothetical protein